MTRNLPPIAGRKILPDAEFSFDEEKVKKLTKAAKKDFGDFFDVHMDRSQKGSVSAVVVVSKMFDEAEKDGQITSEQLRNIEEDEDPFLNSNQRMLYRKDFIRGLCKTENDALLAWIEAELLEKALPRHTTVTWLKYKRKKIQADNYTPPPPDWIEDAHINPELVKAMEHLADCGDRKLGICSRSSCQVISEVVNHNVTCE
jgi:hypothetical protein